MVPTVDEEKSTLLGAQNTRPPTIEMAQQPVAEDDGVLRRDHSRALPARRGLLFRHRSTPDPDGSARCHWGRTPACVNPGAPVVGAARIAARRDKSSPATSISARAASHAGRGRAPRATRHRTWFGRSSSTSSDSRGDRTPLSRKGAVHEARSTTTHDRRPRSGCRCGACGSSVHSSDAPFNLVLGTEMAPHTPQRSSRPGEAVALLEFMPAA